LYNYDFSCRGRIWVCWNADTVKVDVFGMSDQAIHVSVTILATRAEHFRFGPVLNQNKQPNQFIF